MMVMELRSVEAVVFLLEENSRWLMLWDIRMFRIAASRSKQVVEFNLNKRVCSAQLKNFMDY